MGHNKSYQAIHMTVPASVVLHLQYHACRQSAFLSNCVEYMSPITYALINP